MLRRALTLMLCAVAGAAGRTPPASGAKCISNTAAGTHKDVPCPLLRGLRFTYSVPATCLSGPCGLIIDAHGATMDAAQEDANTHMRALGGKQKYIVAQPSAPGKQWLPITSAIDAALVGWVNEALAVSAWHVDRDRVHFMGFSQGASLTAHMVCAHPDLFASFAIMEMCNVKSPTPLSCLKAGSPQPPVLLQNGLKDVSSTNARMVKHFPHIVSAWGLDHGVVIAGGGTTPNAIARGEDWSRTRWLGPTGVPLEFLNHSYVADYALKGHCFPGSTNAMYGCPGALERARGRRAGYVVGEEALAFFVAHPRGAGPPGPPAAPRYHCDAASGACAEAAAGHSTLEKCRDACGAPPPPPAPAPLASCVRGVCTPDPAGVPQPVCLAACG